MTRQFVSQLSEHETIDQVFLANDKQLRANRNGNLYLQVRLSDKTGSLTGMMWNASEGTYEGFVNGDYIRVQGTTQLYNGTLQMIVNRMERVEIYRIDETDFVTLTTSEVDRLTRRLCELLRGIRNYHLRNLAECFLVDDEFMRRFIAAPAGVKHHHAYRGGLLEHVISLMEVALIIAPRYPALDSDQLLFGAFLHDMGKTVELTYERDLGYSDAGQLLGHLVIGVEMLAEKVREAEKLSGDAVPTELFLRLKHMILSHHGEYEYGSPKLPMTLEAIALHYLDNLDAKMHSISQLMRDDTNTDSNWTPFLSHLGRKLFKGER